MRLAYQWLHASYLPSEQRWRSVMTRLIESGRRVMQENAADGVVKPILMAPGRGWQRQD
jgi:hypothetical protein